jgi:hypothetical protein
MSTMRKDPPIEGSRRAPSQAEFARDLELLEQNLEDSREAILNPRPPAESRRRERRDDELARRDDQFARDLEALVQRLAESREAIVQLLSAASPGGDEVPELPTGPVPPLRVLRSPSAAPRPVTTESSEGAGSDLVALPGRSAVRLAASLTVLEGARVNDARPGELEPIDEAVAAAREARGVRRRLMSVVLVAVGAVVLLTALVSVL